MENYRQAGREYQGRVYKGPMVDAFNRLTQSSIPTKSEQVLSAIERRGGFGSSTDRFSQISDPELNPGPGQYKSTTAGESPSMSKKGYGGLISRSPRFKKFQYNTPVPGPGAYTSKATAVQGVSSVFQKPSSKTPLKKPELPAPGSYEVHMSASNITICSPFKSKTKRYMNSASSSPPPWQYNVELSFNSDTKPSPVFRQPIRARRYPINLYDPHAPVPLENTPGPADYQHSTLPPINSKPTANFIPGEVDRFGVPFRAKRNKDMTPGPGSYHTDLSNDRAQVSGAVFMSESDRNVIKYPDKKPGPAFYRPVPVPKKKSFHLNASNMWV